MIDNDWPPSRAQQTRQAHELLTKNGFVVILQQPNHEGFLLRHFSGFENNEPPSDQSKNALRKLWPEYRKGMSGHEPAKCLTLEHVIRASKTEPGLKSLLRSIGLSTRQA